jgi:hypothetical protein
MALPDKNKVLKNQFFSNGKPYCKVTAKSSIVIGNWGYSYFGRPWWGHSGDVAPVITGNIKAILKVSTPYINRFIGVDMTQVEG